MGSSKTHADQTSADNTSIGFDYQYYYFLLKLLKMGKGESVGLEVKDDVHTDLSNNTQLLIQLKHTVQQNANGTPINLTNFDSDLWKTLSNWSKVITDINTVRGEKKNQLTFIEKTEFMLASNKSSGGDVKFYSICENPKSAKIELEKLKLLTKDASIQEYIQDLIQLDNEVLEAFIPKIHFNLDVDNIIDRCKDAIREKYIPPTVVESLFGQIDSQIRQDNFYAIKAGIKIIVTFEQFEIKCRRLFSIARSPDLKPVKYYGALPSTLEDQKFIKQLIDIDDVKVADADEIAQYTRYMFGVKTNLAIWQQSGELTAEEVREFSDEAKLRWQNQFKATHKKNASPDELAREVLGEMRKQQLSFGSQSMGTEFSNGEFYRLSDIPEIGWHNAWMDKYK